MSAPTAGGQAQGEPLGAELTDHDVVMVISQYLGGGYEECMAAIYVGFAQKLGGMGFRQPIGYAPSRDEASLARALKEPVMGLLIEEKLRELAEAGRWGPAAQSAPAAFASAWVGRLDARALLMKTGIGGAVRLSEIVERGIMAQMAGVEAREIQRAMDEAAGGVAGRSAPKAKGL